ncbi:hypothetical protein LMIY3S_04596 [Labrys miyagiensis]
MADGHASMNADRFAALAAAYGGELENWPPRERANGNLFARDERGRAILDMTRKLDAALSRIIEQWGPAWSNSWQEGRSSPDPRDRTRGGVREAKAMRRGGHTHV